MLYECGRFVLVLVLVPREHLLTEGVGHPAHLKGRQVVVIVGHGRLVVIVTVARGVVTVGTAVIEA